MPDYAQNLQNPDYAPNYAIMPEHNGEAQDPTVGDVKGCFGGAQNGQPRFLSDQQAAVDSLRRRRPLQATWERRLST